MYFFTGNISSNFLDKDASAHFFSCRVKTGDKVTLTNGIGQTRETKIKSIDKASRQITLEQSLVDNHNPPTNILIQAIPDKPYLEKLCEVLPLCQVRDIYLFQSQFSLPYTVPNERLNNIMIRSLEQSQGSFLPKIHLVDKSNLENLLTDLQPAFLDTQSVQLKDKTPTQSKVNSSVLCGPEGGFSPQEIQKFLGLGLTTKSLGTTIYPAWLAGFAYFQQNSLC